MVYVFLANGFEEIEALTPCDYLRRCGKELSTVSIYENEKKVKGAHGISVLADVCISEYDEDDAEMLVLPGGMPGTTNLAASAKLTDILRSAYEKKIPIAAICAAPSILGELGMLEGKTACSYPGFEKSLKGATVSEQNVCATADMSIITARGMGCAQEFSYALALRLVTKAIADKVWNSIISTSPIPHIYIK